MTSPRTWPARVMWRLWAFPPATVWGLLPWLAMLAVPVMAARPVVEPDVFWHIRIGADFLATGRITGDPAWTFGPAQPGWESTQVGAEILFALLHSWWGWSGIVAFRMVAMLAMALSTWAALTAVAGRRGSVAASRAAALVAVVMTTAFMTGFEERPQSLSLIVLPWVGVAAVRLVYTGVWPRWWVWGPAVMVWSWFHGAGIVIAPVLVLAGGAHIIAGLAGPWRPALRRAAGQGWPVLVAVLIAPMLGPSGADYYRHAAAISQAASGFIVEWVPASTATPVFVWLLVLLALWAAALVAVAARRGRLTRDLLVDVVMVIMMGLAAVSVARNVLVALTVLAPFVAYRAGQALRAIPTQEWEPVSARIATATMAGVLALTAGLVVGLARDGVAIGEQGPDRLWAAVAADTAREHRMFVDYNLGGQASMLTGAVVSIDGRSDRYGSEALFAHVDAQAGRPGWQDTWKDYPEVTDVVLAEDAGLVDRLTGQGWVTACTDGGFVWLVPAGVQVAGCAPQQEDPSAPAGR